MRRARTRRHLRHEQGQVEEGVVDGAARCAPQCVASAQDAGRVPRRAGEWRTTPPPPRPPVRGRVRHGLVDRLVGSEPLDLIADDPDAQRVRHGSRTVPQGRPRHPSDYAGRSRTSVGTGRRAGFRSLRPQGRVGSTPTWCTAAMSAERSRRRSVSGFRVEDIANLEGGHHGQVPVQGELQHRRAEGSEEGGRGEPRRRGRQDVHEAPAAAWSRSTSRSATSTSSPSATCPTTRRPLRSRSRSVPAARSSWRRSSS